MKHAGTWKLQSRLHACGLPLGPLNDCRSLLFGTASLLRIHIARVIIASVLTAPGTAVPTAIPGWGLATTTSDGPRRFPPFVTAWRRRDRQWGVYRRDAGAGGWIQGGGHFFRARDPIFGSGDPISMSRDPISRARDPIFGSGNPVSRSRDPIFGSGDPISRSRDLDYRVTPPPVGISTHLLMLGAARPLRAVLASLSSSGQ